MSPNCFVVIADAVNPVATGIVAFFFGSDAEAKATAYRDANHPGFGAVPARIVSATVFGDTNVVF